MGLRCSLLGHAYGDSEIERDREESGDEVVVTIREVKTCERCGEETVVSENKEVTAVATPEEVEGDPDEATDDEFDHPAADADAIEEAEEEGPEHDPETDDAVILDDEDEPTERDYGEWPDAEADHADAEADPAAAAEDADHEWPDHADEDAGYDAATPDEEADPDVEFAGTTPEPAAEAEEDADDVETDPFEYPGGDAADPDPEPDDGFTRADDVPAPDVPDRDDEPVLVCPECGYTDPQDSGSLRQGDICPECRSGYLATRDAAQERNR